MSNYVMELVKERIRVMENDQALRASPAVDYIPQIRGYDPPAVIFQSPKLKKKYIFWPISQ